MAKTKSDKSSKKEKNQKTDLTPQRKVSAGIIILFICVALCATFISFIFSWQADQSVLAEFADRNAQPENIFNKIGAYLGNLFIYRGFGIGTFIPLALLALTGLKLLLSLKAKMLNKWFWGILWMLFISVCLGFFSSDATILSGIGGYEINAYLRDYIGTLGTTLLLLMIFCLYLVGKLRLTPEKVQDSLKTMALWIKNGKISLRKPQKNAQNIIGTITQVQEQEDSSLGEEEFVVISSKEDEKEDKELDIYTHKKDIPLLPKKKRKKKPPKKRNKNSK